MPYDLAERLKEVRQRTARLRCEAFIDYAPTVCGLRLRPITLESYNRLLAFDNAFVTGAAIDEAAIAVFVWLHHPAFGQFAAREKRRVFRAVVRALHPRFPLLNAFAHAFAPFPRFRWLRHFRVSTAQERFTEACTEIRRLLHEALHDLPLSADTSPEEEPGRAAAATPPVSFQAWILNTFARDLHQPYAAVASMPLKQLVQLLREHVNHATGGKGLRNMTREEAAIWREHLDRKNPPPASRALNSQPSTLN